MNKTPRLSLSHAERQRLRQSGIRLADLANCNVHELARITAWSQERCQFLVAISSFQTLGSIGPRSAEDLWALGFRSISSLRGANPTEMYERFCKMIGKRADPCVEDVFRCAVAQAENPLLPSKFRQWWNWCEQRGATAILLSGDVSVKPVVLDSEVSFVDHLLAMPRDDGEFEPLSPTLRDVDL